MRHLEPYWTKYMYRERRERFTVTQLIRILLIFAGVGIILMRLNTFELQSKNFDWNEQQITINEPWGETYVLAYKDITDMELAQVSDYGTYVRGMDTTNTSYGIWHNDAYGDYHLYILKSIPLCIVIKANDSYTVLNLESEDITRQLFQEIQKYRTAA